MAFGAIALTLLLQVDARTGEYGVKQRVSRLALQRQESAIWTQCLLTSSITDSFSNRGEKRDQKSTTKEPSDELESTVADMTVYHIGMDYASSSWKIIAIDRLSKSFSNSSLMSRRHRWKNGLERAKRWLERYLVSEQAPDRSDPYVTKMMG